MTQTSIEWLKKELEDYGSNSHLSLDWNTFDELCEQAKQMEKQQQIDFATDFARDYIGFDSVSSDPNAASPAAHYYNQIKK
jgi:hypothetical protein